MMQGKTVDDTFIVMDAFALPVEGTETRVNAQAEGYEYMVEFAQTSKQVRERTVLFQISFLVLSVCGNFSSTAAPHTQVGRLENVVGWYHSHPGYGCWMSGIDCNTQMLNQQYQEPFLALVIDPIRTAAAGEHSLPFLEI